MKRLLILSLLFTSSSLIAKTRNGSGISGFHIGKDVTFKVEGELDIGNGTIEFEDGAKIVGATEDSKIIFDNGTLVQGDSQAVGYTGVLSLSPDGNTAWETVLENGGLLTAQSGHQLEKILIKGAGNRIEGQPDFKDEVVFEDENSELYMGIQSTLTKNICLKGGTLHLTEHLTINDDARLMGPGIVDTNKHILTIGAGSLSPFDDDTNTDAAVTYTENLSWETNSQIHLAEQLELTGTWTVEGVMALNGNGYVWDVSDATIVIQPDAQLRLSGVTLRGVHTGTFVMAEPDELEDYGQLRFTDVSLVMDNHLVFNKGLILVAGDSVIRCNQFDFELADESSQASMIVQGCQLTYDSPQFDFKGNNIDNIVLLNNGSIRDANLSAATEALYLTETTELSHNYFLDKNNPLIIEYATNTDIDLNFLGHTITFAQLQEDDTSSLLVVDGNSVASDPGFLVNMRNAKIENFNPGAVLIENNASLLFKDNIEIDLRHREYLDYGLTFSGKCTLNGNGETLELQGGQICVHDGATLTIKNITITGVELDSIKNLGPSSHIIFDNVVLKLTDGYTFDDGSFTVIHSLELQGAQTFMYTSDQVSTINANSMLTVGRNGTFHYGPAAAAQDRLQFVDASSILKLDQSSFFVGAGGINLLKGELQVERRSFLVAQGSSFASGCILGDGIDHENDFVINLVDDTADLSITGYVHNNDGSLVP